MAIQNACSNTSLDPVDGLLDYINNVKPFHTKIAEVLVEYVYSETFYVSMLEDFNIEVNLLYAHENEFVNKCIGGYSCIPFASPQGWSVVSPNQGMLFEDYPAINPSTKELIVLGNLVDDLVVDNTIVMTSYIEDVSGISKIIDIGTNYFIVESAGVYGSTFDTYFSSSDIVYTTGMPLDDGTDFVITNILVDNPSVGLTRVEVDKTIQNPVPIGYLGLKKLPGDNNGTFTVDGLEYTDGTNNYYGTPLVTSTFTLGDDPHTIITVAESLNPLSSLGPHQSHSVSINLVPAEITKVLSYSHISNLPTNKPDEGYIVHDVIGVTTGLGTGSFTVSGNLISSNIFVGEIATIQGSTLNDRDYTINDITFDGVNTLISVDENVIDATPDGTVRIDVPSNVFYIDGNYSHHFHQGLEFTVDSGSFQGRYLTLYSDYVNGKTRIRTAQDVFHLGDGNAIQEILTTNSFTISNDLSASLTGGVYINIANSTYNDGFYTVVSAVYNSSSNLTTVTVSEDILQVSALGSPADVVENGEMFISTLGFINDVTHGFSEATIFCGYYDDSFVAEYNTYCESVLPVSPVFHEKLEFTWDDPTWFQFIVLTIDSGTNTFTVFGDVTDSISNGDDFRVINANNLDIVCTVVSSPTYNATTNQSTLQVSPSAPLTDFNLADYFVGSPSSIFIGWSNYGWIEHV